MKYYQDNLIWIITLNFKHPMKSTSKYSKLSKHKCLVTLAVKEILPGSLVGYGVFGKQEIANRATELCQEYCNSLRKKFYTIVMCKIFCP